MNLNDLLHKQGIDPSQVIVMRHRPTERELRKVLPWLVHEKPDVFNAYQQKHSRKQEAALEKLLGKGWIASFIGMKLGQAVFAGLYKIAGARPVTYEEYWSMPVNLALKSLGMADWDTADRLKQRLWFDLVLQPVYAEWVGKLVISWPPPELAWWRYAGRNEMMVLSISEESRFSERMPDWRNLVLSWAELQSIPTSWQTTLKHWRGIYFIHDASDGKGYVGSAYGTDNIMGRWLNYAANGHGGNKRLLKRVPENFHFSILQIVAHDLSSDDIVSIESAWKDRLHTRGPFGLNEN